MSFNEDDYDHLLQQQLLEQQEQRLLLQQQQHHQQQQQLLLLQQQHYQQQQLLLDEYFAGPSQLPPSLLSSMQNLNLYDPYPGPSQIASVSPHMSSMTNIQNYTMNYQPTNFMSNQHNHTYNNNVRTYSTRRPLPNNPSIEQIVALAKDEERSFLLDILVKTGCDDMRRFIFEAVLMGWDELIFDLYGSKFIQNLIHYCNRPQITTLVLFLALERRHLLVYMAIDDHGTYVIQKIIKTAKRMREIEQFPRILAPFTKYMMMHKKGRHVIKEFFMQLDKQKNILICEEVKTHWRSIAKDKQGCLALNECMMYMDYSSRNYLLDKISDEAQPLSLQYYGNHALQNVLEMGIPIYAQKIVANLRGWYDKLCTNSHGSHIVEKCLNTKFMPAVVRELLESGKLLMIAQDQFGNYAIQNALRQTMEREPWLHRRLHEELKKGMCDLECNPYGRNVANLLKKCKCISKAIIDEAGPSSSNTERS